MDERVKTFLSENGIAAEHLTLRELCRSSQDAAEAVGTSVENVVKTVLFDCDGKIVACVLCGADRASAEKLSRILKGKPRLLNSEDILERTGYPAGGVPPFGYSALFLIDSRVMERKEIYCGGGTEHSLIKTRPEEIVRANRGIVSDIRV